jgi:NAD(P)H-binding
MAPMKIAVAGATGRVGRHLVDVLEAEGHDVVAMSRSSGVDVVNGDGLAESLAGVECVIDVSTGPSPDKDAATEFFTAASRNLHEAGERAGVRRMVAVSINGCDRFTGGYNAAKVAHERAALSGPIPVRLLRAAQFHEFVEQLLAWGTEGDGSYVPKMRTQLVAAQTVAETLADVATARPRRHPSPARHSRSGSSPSGDEPHRPSHARSARELGQPALEKAPLDVRVNQLERALVGRTSVVDAIEPAQKLRARRVQIVVAVELEPLDDTER